MSLIKKIFYPLRKLYEWTLGLANSPHAEKSLFGVAVAESSFFPIPPDVVMLPMIFARPDKAFRFAAVCTAGSVIGGMIGYAIGHFAWELLAVPVLSFYGIDPALTEYRALYEQYGAWVILVAGFSPLPYKLCTLASGMLVYPFLPFVALSLVARGAKYFLVAALLYYGGPPLRNMIEKNFEVMTAFVAVLVVLGFVALSLG
ncbi:MAG: cytochrome B [Alphaproteobacteria bacterium CG_4_10_14_0_8_um_filter_53_9]|nr:MAG: cytochrome B [Alphaproteobacteria bacterium CG_4_10_14_0_8_um_filter_53_9]